MLPYISFTLKHTFSGPEQTRLWHKTREVLKRSKAVQDLKQESFDAYQYVDSSDDTRASSEDSRRILRKLKNNSPSMKERKLAGIKSPKSGHKSSFISNRIKDNRKSLKFNDRFHNFLKSQNKSKKSKGLKAECHRVLKKKSPTKKITKKNEQKR